MGKMLKGDILDICINKLFNKPWMVWFIIYICDNFNGIKSIHAIMSINL